MKLNKSAALLGFLVALLAFSPVAFAQNYTVTVSTDKSSYSGSQTVNVSGTVSPAPGPNQAVFVQLKNPSGATVPLGTATLTSTGSYTFSFVTGGTYMQQAGTYTVVVTFDGASGQATFQYTPVTPAPTVSGQPFNIRVIAPDQAYPGETVNIFIETTFNGTLAGNSSTVSFHAHVWWVSSPNATAGTFQLLPTPSNFAVGHFITSWKVPSNAALGSVAWVHVPGSYNGYKATGVAGVTIVANPATVQKDLMGNFSSLSTAISSLQTSLSTLSTTVGTIQTTLNNLASSASSLSTALTNIQNSLTSLSNTASSLSSQMNTISSKVDNAASQASSAASAVGTTQLYVLIVAVIAAITLVLELAILVRKLS